MPKQAAENTIKKQTQDVQKNRVADRFAREESVQDIGCENAAHPCPKYREVNQDEQPVVRQVEVNPKCNSERKGHNEQRAQFKLPSVSRI